MKNIPKIAKYSLALAVLLFGRYPLSKFVSSKKQIDVPKESSPEEGYWIKSSTGNIVYVEFEGPRDAQPLIFIHGLNSSLSQWFYQRCYFRNNYRLVLIDLPGHGKSLSPKEFTIDAIADDVRTIIEYFKISNAILYGHSIGGMIVLKYCLKYKATHNLKRIIIQHATYTKALETIVLSTIFQVLEKPFIIPFLKYVIRNCNLIWLLIWVNYLIGLNHLFFRYIYFTGNQSAEQLRYITLISAKNSPATTAKGLLETLKFDIKNDLDKIDVHALIIGAVNDRLTRLRASLYMNLHIKSSELEIVNEGHLSLFENPKHINHTIQAFIEKPQITPPI